MSRDYFEIHVRPTIPAKCLTDIDAWLLFRVFKTEHKDNGFGFSARWSLNYFFEEIFPTDNELREALISSLQACPELCTAVESRIKNGGIILGSVDYEAIFQAIIRRHPDFLQHISIEEYDYDERFSYYDKTFTLITANAIETISTKWMGGKSKLTRYASWLQHERDKDLIQRDLLSS
jgi:hypothetical protein